MTSELAYIGIENDTMTGNITELVNKTEKIPTEPCTTDCNMIFIYSVNEKMGRVLGILFL